MREIGGLSGSSGSRLPVSVGEHEMDIRLVEAPESQSGVIGTLLQEYLRQLSAFTEMRTDEQGSFPYPYLNLYWEEPGRIPYMIEVDGLTAGFALIREVINECASPHMSIAEFYIVPAYQRKGVGKKVFSMIIGLHQGNWQLSVYRNNQAGLLFWRHVFKEYALDTFEEDGSGDRISFSFIALPS